MQSQSEIYKSKLKEKISNSRLRQQQQQQQQQQQHQQPQQQLQRLDPQQQQQQQQQQQKQSQVRSTTSASTKSTAAEGTEAAVVGVGKSTPLPQRRATVKVIKCKKPLCHFKFYLDICDHQLTKRIEEQIRALGGTLEFFLTWNVTHFITDKPILPPIAGNNNNNNSNNNNSLSSRPGTPQTPGTPNTPQTPYSIDAQDGKNNASGDNTTPTSGTIKKTNTRQTRANAILNRVRRASTTTNNALNVNAVSVNERTNSPATASVSNQSKDVAIPPSIVLTQYPYIVWQTEYALHFFKKVQHELKDYLGANSRHDQHKLLSKGRSAAEPIDLKGGGYLKIEAVKHNYRPYYQLFRKSSGSEWPKIELTREDGAFRLIPKKKIIPNTVDSIVEAQEKAKTSRVNEEQKMTRKSRSRSSQHQRPLHAAVQSLKKGAGGGATGSAATNKSSQRNSQAGVTAGGVAATACKQVKESSDKQCGVCEICKIEYDTLTIHLKTKDHEYFAKNSQNFIALDSLIHTSADVNKFLNEDKKVDLEEMEVENIEVIADANEADPLEGSEPLMAMPLLELSDDKRRLGGVQQQTPSPTLREKSKRTTKGKHSSEKFQNIRLSKSPKATATAVKSQTSPLKQQVPLATATSSMLELQRIETNANVSQHLSLPNVTTAVTTRRKPASATTVSPPIRAMLPPSSLYKVVGTPEAICSPTRKTRGDLLAAGDQAVGASPSLIVKFKKVRAAELDRLNGEAENFMFPKQRTSSELPTDIDRHTTSDNARANFSSASLDSISDDGPMEVELAEASEHSEKSTREKKMGKRAIANAKRRKSQSATGTKQRFPIAPIQPELQLKDKQSSHKSVSAKSAEVSTVGKKVNETTTKPAISAAAAKANAAAAVLAAITLPEATRKSSRTATAIVTAATTSSRLLRAAVEAAKHNYRQMAAANDLVSNGRKKSSANEAATKSLPEATVTKTRGSVVKMEDRMGDAESMNNDKQEEESEDDAESTSSSSGSENEDEKNEDDGKAVRSRYFIDDVDDDEDDDDEDVDDDDENDEDYVHCKSRRRKTISYDTPPTIWQSSCGSAKSRMQRALQREEQKSKQLILPPTENESGRGRGGKRKKSSDEQIKSKALNVAAVSKNVKNLSTESLSRTPSPLKQKSTTANFDYANSERLNQMRYSFERVPVGDIWHRVFTRQDHCAERYFEYYGSTNYRKLPYELGPIPFTHTLDSNTCCKLCEKQRTTNFPSKSAAKGFLNADKVKVKSEPIEESEGGATKSRDSSSCNSNDVAKATNVYAMGNAVNVQSEPCATQYKHKHKKLQILQRYQQEQQELQKRQAEQAAAQLHNSSNQLQCDTKASIPVQERARDRQRAGSTHSTTSSTSCASSTATTKTSKNRYLNKHLNKAAAAFLNLELPPRKSPREHASTLALVSCIIKQRQDSQSKPNSETDEPSTTPTPMSVAETAMKSNGTELTSVVNAAAASKAQRGTAAGLSADSSCSAKASPIAADLPVLRSPRHTRSAAVTPVEELRFTTEISENVKRMRRGQNKYDHSPPVALSQTRKSGRGGRQPISSPMGRPRDSYSGIQKFLHSTGRSSSRMSQTPNSLIAAAVTTGKRHRRGFAARRHNSYSGLLAQGSAIPSIRKTGSKKGVLEFEVDTNALKALDTATKYKNVHQLEWQIDKYLQYHASEYDLEEDFPIGILEDGDTMPLPAMNPSSKKNSTTIGSSSASTSNAGSRRIDSANTGARRNAAAPFDTNTPPPTDCFSSDFDLYDLFTNATCGSGTDDDQASNADRKRKGVGLSLYNSLSMQKYFRKRKNLKSNRTGWPKVQKKKTSARQQQILARKIRFLQDIGELTGNGVKEEPEDNKEDENELDNTVPVKSKCVQKRRRNGVITPPESEDEVKVYENGTMQNEGVEDEDAVMDDDTELDAGDSIPEEEDEEDDEDDDDDIEDDGETMADSIEGEAVQAEPDADVDADAAVEADEEDAEEAELEADAVGTPGEDDEDDDDAGDNSNFPTTRNRISRRHTNATPIEEEKLATTNSLTARGCNTNSTGATSTPSTQMLRGSLRRTPQLLNGSLGSCISPSEKAGDNSDIFTVSSDGLDTDLDMSNSQHKCDDDHLHHTNHHHHHSHHHHTQEQCGNHQTPKRKFDLSKYAPNNATSSSCAAEAATAAVKSLAISQFLKKEVRVTCRRLRAPFRRYRYRR